MGQGGARTLLAFRLGGRAVFLYGYAKNERDNIDAQELKALKRLVAETLGWTESRTVHSSISSPRCSLGPFLRLTVPAGCRPEPVAAA
ncbi:type II toxin-antitoxin system RelE/ParE family toxin [Cupriavidus sp. D39]|nr:type II toxin-antitoxin system RelE/ParE family toxin [Cupriavidus sp. D39]